MSKVKDLTEQRFGYLTVINRGENDKYGNARWNCKCECGNYKTILGQRLIAGITRSCGCLHKKALSSKRILNKYEMFDDYGVGWTSNTNVEFYFDVEDFNKIKDYTWLENDQGYVISSQKDDNGNSYRMHRIITNNEFDIVDHKDLNRKNNRKYNLRESDKQTNNINRPANINNKLGLKGIYKLENGQYQAKIQKGKRTYTKNSNDLEFLVTWRLNKEIELYGQFAYVGGVNNVE